MRLKICNYTATSAAGTGLAALRQAIANRQSGLRHNDFDGCDLDTWIGRVDGVEDIELPAGRGHLISRNNQLAWLGLQQDGLLASVAELSDRLGAHRIAVILGTSTSSIGRTEEAYAHMGSENRMAQQFRQPEVHNLHSPGSLVTAVTGLKGPTLTISTACSSSAKVFATAARWIAHGIVDAALVGGIDSLCQSVLYGFNSLELVSTQQCKPFDRERDGINIGEAAGYALLAREDLVPQAEISLLGYGESSDAHHMSQPHPEGKGATLAMARALHRAKLPPHAIDYINLHGTASKANDRIETLALNATFGNSTLASSSKAWTGHTLGAAGILEAVIAFDTLQTELIPGTLNLADDDPESQFSIMTENVAKPVRYAMTNSFGFGGNNASLVFGGTNA